MPGPDVVAAQPAGIEVGAGAGAGVWEVGEDAAGVASVDPVLIQELDALAGGDGAPAAVAGARVLGLHGVLGKTSRLRVRKREVFVGDGFASK